MTIIRAELQTTDFLFLCRSSLLLSEICQNIHIFSFIRSSYFPKFDAQIAANNVSGSLYFKNFPGGACPRTHLGCLTPSALVCMTTHRTLASPLRTVRSMSGAYCKLPSGQEPMKMLHFATFCKWTSMPYNNENYIYLDLDQCMYLPEPSAAHYL